MTHKQQEPAAFKSIFVLVLIFTLLFFVSRPGGHSSPGRWSLVVYNTRENTLLHYLPMQAGESFSLTYTHSVTQRPVEGTFSVTGEGLILPLSTSFDTFGPGLPHLDGSTPYYLEDGCIVVQHGEGPRESIRIWVSSLTQEYLRVGGSQIRLAPLDENPLLLDLYLVPRH